MRKVGLSLLLKLDVRKVLIMLLMFSLVLAGRIQSYVFVHDVPGVKKPPLYDLLKPFDFWSASMFLELPLILFGHLLFLVFPGLSFLAKGWIAYIPIAIYIYLLSSFLVYSHDKWGSKGKLKIAFTISYALMLLFLLPEIINCDGACSKEGF